MGKLPQQGNAFFKSFEIKKKKKNPKLVNINL